MPLTFPSSPIAVIIRIALVFPKSRRSPSLGSTVVGAHAAARSREGRPGSAHLVKSWAKFTADDRLLSFSSVLLNLVTARPEVKGAHGIFA